MAMAVVMCIQVGSALMSAFSGKTFLYFLMKTTTHHGEEEETSSLSLVYMELAVWRFLLGFGCGGVYPLSATITAESSSDKNGRPRLLAKMFSMQGVGYLAVPVVAYALVGLFGNDDDGSSSSDMAWRLLLGTGSLPGFALIITRLYRRKRESLTQQHPQKKRKKHVRLQPTSMLQQIHHEDKLRSKLIGTAGTWLLFDVLFYGNALFQPKVLRSAFGQSETELDLIRDTILIGLLGLPGKKNDEIVSLYLFSVREIDLSATQYISQYCSSTSVHNAAHAGYLISIYLVGKQSPRRIQLQGFLCMAVLYAYIGYNFDSLDKYSLLGLYGLTLFFSNYGPNTTVRWKMMHSVKFGDLISCFLQP